MVLNSENRLGCMDMQKGDYWLQITGKTAKTQNTWLSLAFIVHAHEQTVVLLFRS